MLYLYLTLLTNFQLYCHIWDLILRDAEYLQFPLTSMEESGVEDQVLPDQWHYVIFVFQVLQTQPSATCLNAHVLSHVHWILFFTEAVVSFHKACGQIFLAS